MGGKGPSQQTQDTQNQLTQEQIGLAQQQQNRSDKLFSLTEPGLKSAEDFYSALASGDPHKIQTASAPATEQIAKNFEAQKTNISQNMPRGGARDLAMQEADISKAGAIGSTEANAYLSSFPALASLAGQGIGLSTNEIAMALQGFQGASSSNQAEANMAGAGKAQTLGFLGSLGSSAATGAGLAVGCWIAESIWGKGDLRTIRLRVWLNQIFGRTVSGRVVMFFYRRFGQFVARQVVKRSWVRRLLTPVFEFANERAYRWEFAQVNTLRLLGLM